MQDELLEQVDSAFDLFKKERAVQGLPPPENDAFMYQNSRKKRRREMQTKATKRVFEAEAKAVSMHAEKCPIPFHVWSIPRPQDKFDVPVDNSNTPFRHPRRSSGSLQDAKSDTVVHPLQEELQNMTFEEALDVSAEPKQPASLDETPFTFVNTPSLLKETAAKLVLEREIAVDLEHHQFRSFQGLTCLMQISTRSEDFIIDTLELRSIISQHLYDVFASPTIQKVMHGARLDVLWLQRDFGIYVCNLFDTGQAARVLELETFSLAHLLKSFCGVTPDKRYQMADWRLRPLTVEMIKYAREDTHYLLYIRDLLKQKLVSLQSKDQQELLLEVCKRSCDICLKLYEKEITTDTSFLQVYGLEERNFSPQQLAVLAGLYSWRDQFARVEDESTGYVLPNHLLLKLAEEMPEDVKQLRTMLNGRHKVVARNSATIVNIISKAKLVSQRTITESKPSLEPGKQKSSPLFEEVAFSEDLPVEGIPVDNCPWPEQECHVTVESDLNTALAECSSHISGDSSMNSKAEAGMNDAANVVFQRTTKSALFGMQKVSKMNVDRVETSKEQTGADAIAKGSKLDSNMSGNTPASVVVVKRASGSSLFLKSKKINQVGKGVQGTAVVVGTAPLEVARTDSPETTSIQRTEAEAKARAETIRASFSLPFHSFDGGHSPTQEHLRVTAEHVSDTKGAADPQLQEAEDVILLEADAIEGSSEREAGKQQYTMSKGIGISPDGVQHRLWWPDSLGTAAEPSLNTIDKDPHDVSDFCSLQTEYPVPLSQKFKQQRKGLQMKPRFSQLDMTNSGKEHQSVTPFDYAAAKKKIGLTRGPFEIRQAEGPHIAGYNEARTENTGRIFDPERQMKEFKPEGITPGKRRQVFPQSGNRTGVFK